VQLGKFVLPTNVFLAPMAGITDRPFRILCREFGAGLAAAEMISSEPRLRDSALSRKRREFGGEPRPWVVQIAGSVPAQVADAARYEQDAGADVIDINMGCPAKKVCGRQAGSALLRDLDLVAAILERTVRAVEVPVTLKIRTGWDRQTKNALQVARIAEESGIQTLAVHGRTRADGFKGEAEFHTVAAVKDHVRIPVIANGDITTIERARAILALTKADAVMIGRAALGNPWIFRQASSAPFSAPSLEAYRKVLVRHVRELHEHYGSEPGLRLARKHIRWYLDRIPGARALWVRVRSIAAPAEQLRLLEHGEIAEPLELAA
jgi:tRNA-dihydrouridine synthase B